MAKKIGLALGGGGARGLCHIRFLQVMEKLNITPVIISGTSIGAIIGAFWAGGTSAEELLKLIENINFAKLTKLFDFSIFGGSGLIKGKAVVEFFEQNLKIKTFEELKIPLKIVATDFWNRKEVIIEKGDIVTAIRASSSIPGLFNPEERNGIILTDGGATNPLPYDLLCAECDAIIAIDVSGERSKNDKTKKPQMFESILDTFLIMERSIVENKMKNSKPDLYIKPKLENFELLDFHKHEEILKSVDKDVKTFETQLQELMERKQMSAFLKKIIRDK
jgi:NTE family protein